MFSKGWAVASALSSTLLSCTSSLTGCRILAQTSVVLNQVREAHGYTKNHRLRYFIFKDRPIGPYKKLPPGFKLDGRIGEPANYRKIVHYPEDGEYTVRRLPITKLGGRDPVTGRKVIQGVGGGSKQKHRWIDFMRLPKDWDPEGPDLAERIISINYDPGRKAMIALTGYDNKLRWQIATSSMKAGDLIRTTGKIPSNPVKPVEGDSYPLGALPLGTQICLVQWIYGEDTVKIFNAEQSGTILRKEGDRVVIKYIDGFDYSLDQRCQCVVGTVSIHPLKAAPIGSPLRSIWLGHRPRSGYWQRKTGRFGRKIKKPPPVTEVKPEVKKKEERIILHASTEGIRGAPHGSKRPFYPGAW